MSRWQPSASLPHIRARAALLDTVRKFFSDRGVLEVETPLLAQSAAPDIHIQSWQGANSWGEEKRPLYLQTSPEFAMKRLLSAGAGPIFQICKAFRIEQTSRTHNPEFTMLEWYQPGYSLVELMDEVEQLLKSVVNAAPLRRYSYRELFEEFLQIDPHRVAIAELQELTYKHINLEASSLQHTDYLQLLLAEVIEPQLSGSWFLYDYPEPQAALAQVELDKQGDKVAKRFELFCEGMEIANGYYELTDATEQKRRFEADLLYRQKNDLDVYPLDNRLIEALENGMPNCAGVALGLDRLLMLITGAKRIEDVLSFSIDRA